jgi:sugar/nucleoside kinase (ribokinase family)
VADVLAKPVEGLPPAGTSQPLEAVGLAPGGNAVNTAIALARLGISVRATAAVGDDRLAAILREAVRAEGLDDSTLVSLPHVQTSVSVVLIESDGERRFLHFRGANAFFSSQHIDWRRAEGARVFHYASAFSLPAFDGPPLAEALARAKQLGCLTSLNVCWDTQDRWLPVIRPALAHTDFIFPNLAEGRRLTGESTPEAVAARLRSLGVGVVIIKLGAAGCYVAGPEGAFASPGFQVEAVDTTGAGDCFAAAFLSALVRGEDLRLAARFANAAGALCALGMGAADSAPTRRQVEDLLVGSGP